MKPVHFVGRSRGDLRQLSESGREAAGFQRTSKPRLSFAYELIFSRCAFLLTDQEARSGCAEQPMKSSEPVLKVECAGSASDFLQDEEPVRVIGSAKTRRS